MDDRKPSEVIQEFLDYLKSLSEEYEDCKAVIAEEDAKKQDFLHALEFQMNNKERSKIATIIHLSRLRRRTAKDKTEMLENVVQFFRKEQSKLFIKTLKIMLANQQKEEERLEGERTYIPRTSVWADIGSLPARGGDTDDNS